MRQKEPYDRDSLHFAPFVLFPSPFPKAEFDRSLELQPILNELMHKVAHDRKFLTETLKSTIQVDEFTRKLFEIYETVQNEGVAQVRILSIIITPSFPLAFSEIFILEQFCVLTLYKKLSLFEFHNGGNLELFICKTDYQFGNAPFRLNVRLKSLC